MQSKHFSHDEVFIGNHPMFEGASCFWGVTHKLYGFNKYSRYTSSSNLMAPNKFPNSIHMFPGENKQIQN